MSDLEEKIVETGPPAPERSDRVLRIVWPHSPDYLGVKVIRTQGDVLADLASTTPPTILERFMEHVEKENFELLVLEGEPKDLRTLARIILQAVERHLPEAQS